MAEPIRRTQLPQMTPEEWARMEKRRHLSGEAIHNEERLRVLLIDVARQLVRQRYLSMHYLNPNNAQWQAYELVRISLTLSNGDRLTCQVHPGWDPQDPAEKKPAPEPPSTPSSQSAPPAPTPAPQPLPE